MKSLWLASGYSIRTGQCTSCTCITARNASSQPRASRASAGFGGASPSSARITASQLHELTGML